MSPSLPEKPCQIVCLSGMVKETGGVPPEAESGGDLKDTLKYLRAARGRICIARKGRSQPPVIRERPNLVL